MAKKEISLEWASRIQPIEKAEDIKSSAGANEPNGVLPKGSKFQLVTYAMLPGIQDGKPYEGFLVQLENGRQTGISARVFLGNYFEVAKDKNGVPILLSDGSIRTDLKTVDSPFRKSGLNAIDFLSANEDTIFTVAKPVDYQALRFGSKDEIRPKSQMIYTI